MSEFISLAQAFAQWQELDLPMGDVVALRESWNDYTDSLCKDRELSPLQYHYAPAADEEMPGFGSEYDALSDDREFILDAMGVTMSATFVPFSQSRNKGERNPSLNWKITVKSGDRIVIADMDYMQGCGHAPASKLSVKQAGGENSIMRDNLVRAECETGRVHKPGALAVHGAIDAPDLTNVMHSLLLDGSAIDARDFADWASDYGYDTDSISARDTYDACVKTGLALRAAFGGQKFEELRELFEGM